MYNQDAQLSPSDQQQQQQQQQQHLQPHSAADSDMEMEDDITLTQTTTLDHDLKEQLQAPGVCSVGRKEQDDSEKEDDVGAKSMRGDIAVGISFDFLTEVKGVDVTSMVDVSYKHEKQANSQLEHSSINYSVPEERIIQNKDTGGCITEDTVKENNTKNKKLDTNPPKVDRFGRLVRDCPSDSDSDDVHRHGSRRRRGRSSSHSRSPPVRRRNRSRSGSSKSPRRRRNKRSRSRSWSPKSRRSVSPRNRNKSRSPRNRNMSRSPRIRNRSRSPRIRNRSRSPRNRNRSRSPRNRYRSRSPSFRRDRGVGRVKVEMCFDFTRGRCQRGASCRYLHNDSDNMGSNQYTNIQKHVNTEVVSKHYSDKVSSDMGDDLKSRETDAITCIDVNRQETTPLEGMLSVMSPGRPLVETGTFKSNFDESQQTDNSSLSKSSLVRKSAASPTKVTAFPDIPDVAYPYSYGENGVHSANLPNSMPPFSSGPPYMLANQNPNFNFNSSWASLPPPPPRLPQYDSKINSLSGPTTASLPFQPNYTGSQTNARPYMTELPNQSQVGGLPYQTYPPHPPPPQESHRPVYSMPSQQFNNPGSLNDSSYPWATTNPQPMSYDYHNPRPSTLEPPLSMGPNTSFSLSHPPVDGQNYPRYGGNQYNPLSDSMDPPPPNLSQKVDNFSNSELTSNYENAMLKSDSKNKLDMQEHNRRKDDEAEVGSVENESLTDPGDDADMTAGEIEIDETQSPGKSRTDKDSRSMKHFKVAVADFVKEVLKPSWRQGNMSKEAFKTIVKKTVDKVSGAMKGRHAPKSKAKIEQYIDSQQRKLTKLVMGYVDKYVKQ